MSSEIITKNDLKAILDEVLPSCAIDFPIEQGFGVNSTGWSYTKWNSGKLECWYTGNPGSYTCGTARGNMYAGGWLTMTYPTSYLTGTSPTVTASVTLTTDAYCVHAQISEPASTTVKIRITSSGSIAANSNYSIKVYAVGRWK